MERRGSPEKLIQARRMRKQPTDAERRVWSLLRNRQIQGLKFRRQAIVRGFIVDFYCADRKLVIELDGEVHNNQIDYDAARDERLQMLGYRVIRLRNEEADLVTIERLISPRPEGERGRG